MAEQHLLPASPDFPSGVETISHTLELVIRDQYRILASRLESLITVGLIADRPAADGSIRFYFATDDTPPTLYIDDGTWNAV